MDREPGCQIFTISDPQNKWGIYVYSVNVPPVNGCRVGLGEECHAYWHTYSPGFDPKNSGYGLSRFDLCFYPGRPTVALIEIVVSRPGFVVTSDRLEEAK